MHVKSEKLNSAGVGYGSVITKEIEEFLPKGYIDLLRDEIRTINKEKYEQYRKDKT